MKHSLTPTTLLNPKISLPTADANDHLINLIGEQQMSL